MRSAALAALGLTLLAGGQAQALLSAASGTATGTTCGASNNADRSCTFSAGLTVNTGTTITSKHGWNINADIGVFSTSDQSSSAQHNVAFNATAVGGYRLDISTSRLGDINRNSDAAGCDGAADTSGISGSSNIMLNSGTLSLADPGGLGNGGSTTSIPFSQSSGTAQIFRVSNGVAQVHSLTFTWTGSVRSNSCEAAVRQGQQNGTTTGCSACGYPGSPSRSETTDGHFVLVTFTSLCGNGTVDVLAGEQCDQGGANGSAGSCCTSQCQFKLIGTSCRAAAGFCDFEEFCSGLSGVCPADLKKPNGTGCRASAGQCDIEEVCNGSGNNCPPDGFEPPSTICRAGSAGEVCDETEFCPGNAAACPPDAVKPNGTLCRSVAGDCDVAEFCDGSNKFCPVDGFVPFATSCRALAGDCDIEEFCSGSDANCPPDAFQPGSFVCRGAGGLCDIAENCPGNGPACPGDAKSVALCRASAGVCDVAENCNGVNDHCPNDAVQPNGTECRASAGICDVADVCNGGVDCPADGFQPNTVECRGAADVCDVAENCSGSGAACPADAKSTAECRASAGACDVAEVCDGAGDDCPADQLSPSGATCRAAAGACDIAEVCDGASAGCPSNTFQPSGTMCPDGLFCNGNETCNGSGSCVDAADPCPIVCSEGLDLCLASGCPAGPIPGCKTAQKSLLLIKNNLDSTKDKLVWKWIKGQSTSQAQFADPLTTANYALCIFNPTLAAQIDIPPSVSKWSLISTKGFKYFDVPGYVDDGAQKAILKGSSSNKSKILIKGRGGNLPDPIDSTALGANVTVQLINHDNGQCFQSFFATPKTNTTAQYKAKTP